MKPKVITTLSIDEIEVPKINDKIDGTLEFKYHIDDIYEIIYLNNSYGFFNMGIFNNSVLKFFEKLVEVNNGSNKQLENKLEQFAKNNPQCDNNKNNENNKYIQYSSIYPIKDIPYLIGLEDNIIKKTCAEYNISYQELADATGMNIMSLRSVASSHKISRQIKRSIELYVETIELKKELEQTNQMKTILKNWLK